MNEDTKQFIADHLKEDVHQLSLKTNRNKLIDIDLAIRQIAGRQKIKNKIPRFYENDAILYPVQLSIEQSSSESTARYKSTLCKGETLIDLTGGFGIDCCFMSVNFKKAIYIEKQQELCEITRHNFQVLNKHNIEIRHSDTEKIISSLEEADWIFIDPARRNKTGNKVVLLSDCEPDVSQLSEILLRTANNVMIKLSPMLDISAALVQLAKTSEVHVISVDNECKEVLFIMSRNQSLNPTVKTINITKDVKYQTFNFEINEEKNADAEFCSKIENYLYEPNASILKSGAFKLVSTKYKLKKLHRHTHLYTSNILIRDFPGRIFELIKVWENTKNELKRVEKANISTRNYPLNAENLRKKLKIKPGGDIYLFACTIYNDKKVILECSKAII
ncbi:MAG: SAM-dependent methyltransferase [Paludibacter sp.]|nr:SAM-dependent methyltransferase [Paludibacter sp.]